MATPEGLIQSAICEYLALKKYFFFRTNNTPVFDRKLNNGYGGYRSQGKWAQPGLADILLLKDGTLYGIEVKTPKGKQSADQMLFEKRIQSHGGIYVVARSVDDVIALGL